MEVSIDEGSERKALPPGFAAPADANRGNQQAIVAAGGGGPNQGENTGVM